jgi:hypothetical protein
VTAIMKELIPRSRGVVELVGGEHLRGRVRVDGGHYDRPGVADVAGLPEREGVIARRADWRQWRRWRGRPTHDLAGRPHNIDDVGGDAVPPSSACRGVACLVPDPDSIVACASVDLIPARASRQRVVACQSEDAVIPAPAVDVVPLIVPRRTSFPFVPTMLAASAGMPMRRTTIVGTTAIAARKIARFGTR